VVVDVASHAFAFNTVASDPAVVVGGASAVLLAQLLSSNGSNNMGKNTVFIRSTFCRDSVVLARCSYIVRIG